MSRFKLGDQISKAIDKAKNAKVVAAFNATADSLKEAFMKDALAKHVAEETKAAAVIKKDENKAKTHVAHVEAVAAKEATNHLWDAEQALRKQNSRELERARKAHIKSEDAAKKAIKAQKSDLVYNCRLATADDITRVVKGVKTFNEKVFVTICGKAVVIDEKGALVCELERRRGSLLCKFAKKPATNKPIPYAERELAVIPHFPGKLLALHSVKELSKIEQKALVESAIIKGEFALDESGEPIVPDDFIKNRLVMTAIKKAGWVAYTEDDSIRCVFGVSWADVESNLEFHTTGGVMKAFKRALQASYIRNYTKTYRYGGKELVNHGIYTSSIMQDGNAIISLKEANALTGSAVDCTDMLYGTVQIQGLIMVDGKLCHFKAAAEVHPEVYDDNHDPIPNGLKIFGLTGAAKAIVATKAIHEFVAAKWYKGEPEASLSVFSCSTIISGVPEAISQALTELMSDANNKTALKSLEQFSKEDAKLLRDLDHIADRASINALALMRARTRLLNEFVSNNATSFRAPGSKRFQVKPLMSAEQESAISYESLQWINDYPEYTLDADGNKTYPMIVQKGGHIVYCRPQDFDAVLHIMMGSMDGDDYLDTICNKLLENLHGFQHGLGVAFRYPTGINGICGIEFINETDVPYTEYSMIKIRKGGLPLVLPEYDRNEPFVVWFSGSLTNKANAKLVSKLATAPIGIGFIQNELLKYKGSTFGSKDIIMTATINAYKDGRYNKAIEELVIRIAGADKSDVLDATDLGKMETIWDEQAKKFKTIKLRAYNRLTGLKMTYFQTEKDLKAIIEAFAAGDIEMPSSMAMRAIGVIKDFHTYEDALTKPLAANVELINNFHQGLLDRMAAANELAAQRHESPIVNTVIVQEFKDGVPVYDALGNKVMVERPIYLPSWKLIPGYFNQQHMAAKLLKDSDPAFLIGDYLRAIELDRIKDLSIKDETARLATFESMAYDIFRVALAKNSDRPGTDRLFYWTVGGLVRNFCKKLWKLDIFQFTTVTNAAGTRFFAGTETKGRMNDMLRQDSMDQFWSKNPAIHKAGFTVSESGSIERPDQGITLETPVEWETYIYSRPLVLEEPGRDLSDFQDILDRLV